jgi:hypothetical protein
MTQSRRHSAIETVCGVAAGFALSLAASPIVYPLFGHTFTFTQNVGITIVFTVLSLVRGYAVRRAGNWWQQRKAKPAVVVPPPPAYDPKDVALNSQPAKNKTQQPEWYSLPGGRLELGQTGFYITLNPDQPKKVYQGHTPEHFLICWGMDLAGMKATMEVEARERAEFNQPAGGWTS